MKYEWRKAEKSLYGVKASPKVVEVPEQSFIMLDGTGNPNLPGFAEEVSALYALAYAIKMDYKKSHTNQEIQDFTVYPLEGIWQQKEQGELVKEELIYTIMIAQPSFISKEMVKEALEKVKVKKPNAHYEKIRFETIKEGKCLTMLHLGSFDSEPLSFAKMDEFCKENFLNRRSLFHREIYLNNLNRTSPDKLKTILRYQVE
ncbi:GyrI-like domain-containing protein [Streptococcus sp.]|uniref:GyrI-like domain-containing protein n=1 Tax=Streptococcus sp. TaxID=1306 RepID=UPI0028FFD661|nr:GyrI-like domain-containing protein [Streptococcus sp.]MDU3103088.1 GyrI-like domain-containing protein [Streptococcus sp.]